MVVVVLLVVLVVAMMMVVLDGANAFGPNNCIHFYQINLFFVSLVLSWSKYSPTLTHTVFLLLPILCFDPMENTQKNHMKYE